MPSFLLEQALADLIAKKSAATTEVERRAFDGAIADLAQGLLADRGAPLAPTKPVSEAAATPGKPMPEASPFYGLGLREACPKQLLLAGKPQTAREIWDVLESAGYTTAHSNPSNAVTSAMKRRAFTHGDVFQIGEGKWALTSKYSEDEIASIKDAVRRIGDRNVADHREKTIAGMKLARVRGAHPGAPPKLTDEQWAELEVMLGEKPVNDVAEHFGIHRQSIYRRYPRGKLKELRAGKQMSDDPQKSRGGPLRVVK